MKHFHVPKHAQSCVKLIDTQINSFSSDCNLAIHITCVIYSLLIHLLVEYFQETLTIIYACESSEKCIVILSTLGTTDYFGVPLLVDQSSMVYSYSEYGLVLDMNCSRCSLLYLCRTDDISVRESGTDS